MKDIQGIELIVGDRVVFIHWQDSVAGVLRLETVIEVTPDIAKLSNGWSRITPDYIALIPTVDEDKEELKDCDHCKREHKATPECQTWCFFCKNHEVDKARGKGDPSPSPCDNCGKLHPHGENWKACSWKAGNWRNHCHLERN